jgi:hypothetical protein
MLYARVEQLQNYEKITKYQNRQQGEVLSVELLFILVGMLLLWLGSR